MTRRPQRKVKDQRPYRGQREFFNPLRSKVSLTRHGIYNYFFIDLHHRILSNSHRNYEKEFQEFV